MYLVFMPHKWTMRRIAAPAVEDGSSLGCTERSVTAVVKDVRTSIDHSIHMSR